MLNVPLLYTPPPSVPTQPTMAPIYRLNVPSLRTPLPRYVSALADISALALWYSLHSLLQSVRLNVTPESTVMISKLPPAMMLWPLVHSTVPSLGFHVSLRVTFLVR